MIRWSQSYDASWKYDSFYLQTDAIAKLKKFIFLKGKMMMKTPYSAGDSLATPARLAAAVKETFLGLPLWVSGPWVVDQRPSPHGIFCTIFGHRKFSISRRNILPRPSRGGGLDHDSHNLQDIQQGDLLGGLGKCRKQSDARGGKNPPMPDHQKSDVTWWENRSPLGPLCTFSFF